MPDPPAYGKDAYARYEASIRQAMITPSKTRPSHVARSERKMGAQNGSAGNGLQKASHLNEHEEAAERARREWESHGKGWKYGQHASVSRNPSQSQPLRQALVNDRIIRGQRAGVEGLHGERSERPQRKMNLLEEDHDDEDDGVATLLRPSSRDDVFTDDARSGARGNMHGGQIPYRNAKPMAPPPATARMPYGYGYINDPQGLFPPSLFNNDAAARNASLLTKRRAVQHEQGNAARGVVQNGAGDPSFKLTSGFPHYNAANFGSQRHAGLGQENSASRLNFKTTKQTSNIGLPSHRIPQQTPAQGNRPTEGSKLSASKTIPSLFQEDDF